MKSYVLSLMMVGALVLSGEAFALRVNTAAPDFSVKDSNGKMQKLSEYKGKFVVLEWHNQGCPYVKKHYESGNMQKLQKEATGEGVVWLAVLSSAKGKEGYVDGNAANAYMKKQKASPTAVLMDPEGTLGKLYGAKTTPHMFVIDPKGTLVYEGAIDDKATADKEDIATAKNYVSQALKEAKAGKVTTPSTPPYGCSVKYSDAR